MKRDLTDEQARERECIHRGRGASAGDYYKGTSYVQAIQRLRGEEAVRFAGRVAPFFWSDAAHITVWLCDGCAEELGLFAPAAR
jgi:hypothetical protein